MDQYYIARIKAKLLSGGTVTLSKTIAEKYPIFYDNHHHNAWIFLALSSTSRVRLTVENVAPAFLLDVTADAKLFVVDYKTNEIIATDLIYEEAIVHAPEQLFLGLYEYCNAGCRFCPCSVSNNKIHYSLDSIYEDIDNSNGKIYSSIGITTSIPPHLSADDVADEMIFIVKKIREKVGMDIPLGVSTKIPTKEKIILLKEAGADEIRLNMEIPNKSLSKVLMPNKPVSDILKSIETACAIFGRGKVSSNLVVGLGETDTEILNAVEKLAKMGAIATLYPYDPIETNDPFISKLSRPSPDRLLGLAIEHKRILKKYNLQTDTLLTMCPSCAASHIFPGRDL